jgi:hypothetical protein
VALRIYPRTGDPVVLSFRGGRDGFIGLGPLGRFRISSSPEGEKLRITVMPQGPADAPRPAPAVALLSPHVRAAVGGEIPFDLEWLPDYDAKAGPLQSPR